MSSEKSDPTLAKPSAACCLTGTMHKGQARGKSIQIEEVETYVAEPAAGKANGNILLYFPDVFGLFNNAKLIMDAFADAGYLTLGLDYFRGDPVWKHETENIMNSSTFDFNAWKDKHIAFSDPFTPKWVEAVKKQFGKSDTKYACVGYCWGAPYVCNQLSSDGICSVGAFAHPAFLQESHFKKLQKPLFLSCAQTDMTFPNEFRNKAVDILQEEGKDFQVQLFAGVAHGFALRCNPEVRYEQYAKEMSLKGMIDYFDFHLSK